MAVTFTAAKALLVAEAQALSAEATAAGLASLATALSNLATEINQAISEQEFFGGGVTSYSYVAGDGSGSGTDNGSAAVAWSQMLISAANIIKTKNSTAIKTSIANIETDIDTIATQTTAIAVSEAIIATQTTEIKSILELIRSYQEIMKNLAVGPGIHVVSPYETFTIATLWKLLVLEGKILEDYSFDKFVPDSEQKRALEYLRELVTIIRVQIPKDF